MLFGASAEKEKLTAVSVSSAALKVRSKPAGCVTRPPYPPLITDYISDIYLEVYYFVEYILSVLGLEPCTGFSLLL